MPPPLLTTVLLSALTASAAQGFSYSKKSGVVTLDDGRAFRDEVLNYPGVAIVEFYAPWCGHCKAFKPEYQKAAKLLDGVAKVVAVDASAEQGQSIAGPYGVQGFPTVLVFGADKTKPVPYDGPRTADGLSDAALKAVRGVVRARKGGGGSASDGGSKSGGEKPRRKASSSSSSAVMTVGTEDFEEKVLNEDSMVLVEFFAPWCGHCKALAPEWEAAAESLKDHDIVLAAVDATAEEALARRYGVKGYPTIKVFPPGKKTGPPMDYQGPRENSGIVAYALQLQDQAGVEPTIPQALGHDEMSKKCSGKRICVLAVLPHILDSGAQGRNDYLEMLIEVAKTNRGSPFRFFWSEGGSQPAIESAFEMSFGFPALAAFSLDKDAFVSQKGSFNKEGINNFLLGVLSGREKVGPVAGGSIPRFEDVTAWDGQDATAEEEEISLEDLGLDFATEL